ncbi:MAG: hypothetical protein ACRBCS_15940 [Cellvibrionaceae bacterium]
MKASDFLRAVHDFRKLAGEYVKVYFEDHRFKITGTNLAIQNLKEAYKDASEELITSGGNENEKYFFIIMLKGYKGNLESN